MAKRAGPSRHSAWLVRSCLAAIVAAAMALSGWWAWRVPIFQAPDEDVHFDYVVSLRTEGRLLYATDRPVAEMAPGGFFHPYNPLTHPYTFHLSSWTRAREIRLRPQIKVPANYATAEHFAAIERTTQLINNRPYRTPFVLPDYPVGYYALAALWTKLWAPLFPGIVAMFFAARAFSILLFGAGLLATFGVLRRMGATATKALALTAAIGFFPMSSAVSSYIQPDNLVFPTLAACMWVTFDAARAARPRRRDLFAIGVLLAVLLLAKLHVFVAAAVPVAATLALAEVRRGSGRWLESGLLLIDPR